MGGMVGWLGQEVLAVFNQKVVIERSSSLIMLSLTFIHTIKSVINPFNPLPRFPHHSFPRKPTYRVNLMLALVCLRG